MEKILEFARRNWAILLVMAGAIFLRFYHLRQTPGLYPDEGVYFDIAKNLSEGKFQFGNFAYPFLPHPILFFIPAAISIKIIGPVILALRALNALLAVVAIYVLYLVGREIKGHRLGIIIAAIATLFPLHIYTNRMALTYTSFYLIAALFILYLTKALNKDEDKNYFWMGIIAGLSAIDSVYGFVLIAFYLVFLLIKRREYFFKGLFVSTVIPFTTYCAIYLWNQNLFVQRLSLEISRPDTTGAVAKTIFDPATYIFYGTLNAPYYQFFLLGAIGLVFLPKKSRLYIAALGIILLLAEYKTRGLWWYILTFAPVVFIGAGALVEKTSTFFENKKLIATAIILVCFLMPTSPIILNIIQGKFFGKSEELWYSATRDEYDRLNKFLEDKDGLAFSQFIPVSNINLGVYPPGRLLMYYSGTTSHSAKDAWVKDWFVGGGKITDVKYAIIDKFLGSWQVHQSPLKEVIDNWNEIYTSETMRVFENPQFGQDLSTPLFGLPYEFAISGNNPEFTSKMVVDYDEVWTYNERELETFDTGNPGGYSMSQNPTIVYGGLRYSSSELLTNYGEINPPFVFINDPDNYKALPQLFENGSVTLVGNDEREFVKALAVRNSNEISYSKYNEGWTGSSFFNPALTEVTASSDKARLTLTFKDDTPDDLTLALRMVCEPLSRSPISFSLNGDELLKTACDRGYSYEWKVFDLKNTKGANHFVIQNWHQYNDIGLIKIMKRDEYYKNYESAKTAVINKIEEGKVANLTSPMEIFSSTVDPYNQNEDRPEWVTRTFLLKGWKKYPLYINSLVARQETVTVKLNGPADVRVWLNGVEQSLDLETAQKFTFLANFKEGDNTMEFASGDAEIGLIAYGSLDGEQLEAIGQADCNEKQVCNLDLQGKSGILVTPLNSELDLESAQSNQKVIVNGTYNAFFIPEGQSSIKLYDPHLKRMYFLVPLFFSLFYAFLIGYFSFKLAKKI